MYLAYVDAAVDGVGQGVVGRRGGHRDARLGRRLWQHEVEGRGRLRHHGRQQVRLLAAVVEGHLPAQRRVARSALVLDS